MGEVAAIGAPVEVTGFALAGARVYPAEQEADVRAAWHALPGTVAVVILTDAAAGMLADERQAPAAPLTVVLPP